MYPLWSLEFLWHFFKGHVFENNLRMLQHLQQNITVAISGIRKQI